ncbi:uncharacterized protein [Anabrus simplex]|uniref:uncharacterized protein n=1 Tax=Anabrus simplex TaxID=316456 RepID=UPI0035A2D95F
MSVIIRLQNLPWSANALDIRQYFRGLSIPEGGVHIVGGEQGDAFIAFSTDEDARQAMMIDGGKIKEVKIKLMLSSRTEMQKVIEHARQQSMSLHSFMQMPAPPIAPVHTTLSSLIGTLQATGVTSSVTTPPPAASISSGMDPSVMAAVTQQSSSISPVNNTNSSIGPGPMMGGGPLVNNIQDRRDERKDLDTTSSNKFKDRKERSRSREADRRSDRKERDRERDRDRHRDRERDRRSSRRDRSRSRERDRRRSSRRDRSRTRDRSRSRDRTSRDRGRSSVRDTRRDSSVNRASHSDDDKDKENDVILVAQYPNKEAMSAATKATEQVTKQALKPDMPPIPTSSASSKVPTTEAQSGLWSGGPSLGQQSNFNKPSLIGPGAQTPMGMNSMTGVPSMASRPMQMGMGGGMDLRAGSSFPGELSRNVGSSLGSGMGGMSESMQGSFMRDGGFPGSGRDVPGSGRDLPGSGRDLPGRDLPGRDLPGRDLPGSGRDMQTTGREMPGSGRDIPIGNRDLPGQSSLRARESWPPSRQPTELGSRFGPRDRLGGGSFPVKQDPLHGGSGFGEAVDEYDRGDFDPGMNRGFRGGGNNSYRGGGGSMDYRRGMYSQPADSRMGPRSLMGPGSMLDRMSGMPPQGNDMVDRRSGAPMGSGSYRNQFRGESDFAHHRGGGDRFGMDPYERQYVNDRHFTGRPSSFPTERFPTRERFGPSDRGFDPRTKNIQAGLCVEIRHMPPETVIGDIRRFFQGLYISNNAVKIINDNHGNRVGIAYVKFVKLQDKEMAMHYTGKTIRGSIVEILHLEDDIFDKAIDQYQPPQETDMEIDSPESVDQLKQEALSQFVCLSVHDLPPYVKEEDIFKLFQGYTVVEVVMSVSKGPKKEYEAYVKFSHHEDAKKALHSQAKYIIGHKVVAVKPCSVEQLQEARKQQNGFEEEKDGNGQEASVVEDREPEPIEQPPSKPPPQDSRNRAATPEEVEPVPEEPTKGPMPQATSDCILLKGLPVQANDRDILDFFSDIGLVPLRIHIMLDKFGKATGDAFCEFATIEEASRSLTKHNTPLGKQEVNVIPITRADMNEALGIPAYQPEPLMVGGGGGGGGGGNLRPPMLMGGGRNFGRTGLLGASPGSLSGRMPMMGSRGPLPQDNPVEGFGKPGCVLALENIPFKADIEEILEFLGDFDVSRENVIRRFNERGMPTGEARVAFTSPGEAQRALRELRTGRIRGRSIYMKPL